MEHLDRQAQRLEPVREPRLDRRLVAGDAGDPDQRTARSATSAAGSTASAAARAAAGSVPGLIRAGSGRVRQVTPPVPFSPTSSQVQRVDLAARRLEPRAA